MTMSRPNELAGRITDICDTLVRYVHGARAGQTNGELGIIRSFGRQIFS